MTLRKSGNPQRALDASVELGRILPTCTPHLRNLATARDLVGCSPSTLRNYVQAWEEAFGPLPRAEEGQILISDSLTHLFQLIYELPTEFKQDGLRSTMCDYGRDHPGVLLEIAREYNTSAEIAHGKTQFVNTLSLFVQASALHAQEEMAKKQQKAIEEISGTQEGHAEVITHLQEWAEEVNAFVLTFTKLVRTTLHVGEQHLDQLLSRTRLKLPPESTTGQNLPK